ncbi:MAG TPA: DNA polymerase IV [Saprospiraceae bacterium]|nr:DNA polymerase IV [Saprospiraceae bacterium]
MTSRKIIHIDMDAFYASVEQRDHPELRNKPVAVGGSSLRGVVASASYEARKYGVRSAMPSVTAKRLCPDLIFVKSRFDVYREVSQQIRAIFHEYTDLVEPLSLDEAYLDVTEPKAGPPSATIIAQQIRRRIEAETGLTASAGISFNKFLAKVASDINKPNGMKTILPAEAAAFLDELPVEKFHGIGKVTAKKMRQMGLFTGRDLRRLEKITMVQRFGKVGLHYYHIVRAEDKRPVNPNRIRKSIGAERTFSKDLRTLPEMKDKLRYITKVVFDYMKKADNYGRSVTLKIKSTDFKISTRSRTFMGEIRSYEVLLRTIFQLLEENQEELEAVRLLGVSVSNLSKEHAGEGIQLEFDFEEEE